MISDQTEYVSQVSLSRVAAFMTICGILIFFAIWAKIILVPLVFALVFALTLRPVAKRLESLIKIRWLATGLTFLAVAVPIATAILLFSYQTISVIDDLPTITEEFQESLNRIFLSITQRFNLDYTITGSEWAREQLGDALDEPFLYVRALVTSSASVVGTLLLIFLYTFLFLLYRQPIYHFILGQFSRETRDRLELVFADTQRMSYTYLKGLATVMFILGMMNSAGLLIIGIDYAFFWGFLAAFLAIIPYVGTFVGGLLPFLYALSTTDTTWQPISVALLFLTVQTIEGNIITPKVVGSSIQVNPLAAIIALFFGGFIWGVEGLILALPLTAILRILLVHSTRFRPFGLLLSDDLATREEEFLGSLDAPTHRIINFFRVTPRGVFNADAITDRVHYERKSKNTEVDVDIEVEVSEADPLPSQHGKQGV